MESTKHLWQENNFYYQQSMVKCHTLNMHYVLLVLWNFSSQPALYNLRLLFFDVKCNKCYLVKRVDNKCMFACLHNSPEEKVKQMEKKVNELIEESCFANDRGEFPLVRKTFPPGYWVHNI